MTYDHPRRTPPIRFPILLCVITGLALGVGMSVGGAGASTRVTTDQSWTDPAGDAGTAPDMTAITLSDNPTTGMITLSVTVANFQPISYVDVFFDTDKNASTGSPSGSEFSPGAERDAAGLYFWNFEAWDGSAWKDAAS